jgi:hypothetical protein
VDILIISVAIAILCIIPMFLFFVKIFITFQIVEDTKEMLSLSSTSVYSIINREVLGTGSLQIDEESAKNEFYNKLESLITDNHGLIEADSPYVEFSYDNRKILIKSEVKVNTGFNRQIEVGSSMEFVIDNTMGGS